MVSNVYTGRLTSALCRVPKARVLLFGTAITALFAASPSLWAQSPPKAAETPLNDEGQSKAPPGRAKVQPLLPAAAISGPVLPDANKTVLLVRVALLTLGDALRSGNFTVLRDVAAPGFREKNTAAALSQTFAGLMQSRIDLSAVAIMTPQLTAPPAINPENGLLSIEGVFPGEPVRIDFKLLFQAVDDRWRIFGLSVSPVAVTSGAAAHAPQIESNTGGASAGPGSAADR